MKQKRIFSLLLVLLLVCQLAPTALAGETGPEIAEMAVLIPARRATVTLNPDGRDALLLVAVYTRDFQLAEVREQEVSGGETQEVSVQFTRAFPEGFCLHAMLVDQTTYAPLCAPCLEYSVSLKPTIYDYDEDRVLNFDERADENFAALAEGVIVLRELSDFEWFEEVGAEEEDSFTLYGVSDGAANALAIGARVVIFSGGRSYSVEIKSLIRSGDGAVTLSGQEPEGDSIGKFFDYFTIDQLVQGGEPGEIIYADGVTPVQSVQLMEGGSLSVPDIIKLGIKKKILGAELSGTLTARLFTRVTFQYGKDERMLSHWSYRISMDNTFDMGVSLSGSINNNNADDEEYALSICDIRKWIPNTAMEFVANISLPLRVELNGELSVETTIKMHWSMTGSDHTEPVVEQTYSNDGFRTEAKVEFVVDTGVSVTVGIEAIRLLYIEGGAQFRERMNALWAVRNDGDEQHLCDWCIDGTITPYIKVWFSLGLKDFTGKQYPWWEKEKTFVLKDRVQRFYISHYQDQVTFGWGECPHISYKLSIGMYNPVSGYYVRNSKVTLAVTDGQELLFTETQRGEYPNFTIYLPKGTYTISASAQGYQTAGIVYTAAGCDSLTMFMTPEGSTLSACPVCFTGANRQGESYQLFTYDSGNIYVFGAPLSKEEMIARVAGGERIYWTNWGKYLISGVYKVEMGELRTDALDEEKDGLLYNAQIDGQAIYSIEFGAGSRTGGFGMPISTLLTSLRFNGGAVDDIFSDCPNLTHVDGLETVTAVNATSFSGSGLRSADLSNASFIWQMAFQDCEELTSVRLGSGLVRFSVFESCSKLETVDFGSVETIEDYAFRDCLSLKNANLPATLKTLGMQAFQNCKALTSVKMPGIERIGIAAFRGCSNLREVEIAAGLTEIPNSMFDACSSLEEVIIPDGVTKLDQYAFRNCRSLERVRIPDSVTEIGWNCFDGCPSLMDIEYGGTMDQWGSIGRSFRLSHRVRVHCADGMVIA